MATERARRAWEAQQEATHAAELHAEQQRAHCTEVRRWVFVRALHTYPACLCARVAPHSCTRRPTINTQVVLETAAEMEAARAKAAFAKMDRQTALDRKRERLKAAFLKKQLEKTTKAEATASRTVE